MVVKHKMSDIIHKFPRTKHITNALKSATRDDLIMTAAEASAFIGPELIITEKCDGANLGFSLGEDYTIRIQNRSHYVSAKEGDQFKILGKWVEDHREALYAVLDPPLSKILFGELVYIKHSIEYTALPDYFLAFDLYDITTGKFMAYDRLVDTLKDTNIHVVPVISRMPIVKIADLLPMVNQQSHFCTNVQKVEGIYIKVCDAEHVLHRSKLVRTDFLAGGEDGEVVHWKKKEFVKNQLVKDQMFS